MTTPARKDALQWVHDQGEFHLHMMGIPFSDSMRKLMIRDGHLHWRVLPAHRAYYSLTDAGHRALHDVGK